MKNKITLLFVVFLLATGTTYSKNKDFIIIQNDNFTVNANSVNQDFDIMVNDGGISGNARFFANNLQSKSQAAEDANQAFNNIIIFNNGNPAYVYVRYTPPTGFVGQDSFSYKYFDNNGIEIPNTTFQVIINVNSNDVTPPVITLNTPGTQTIEVGTAYTELGATDSDNVDGDISNNISITGCLVLKYGYRLKLNLR